MIDEIQNTEKLDILTYILETNSVLLLSPNNTHVHIYIRIHGWKL